MLAINNAGRHFRHCLKCKKFKIYTDHKPLLRAFQSSQSQEIGRRAKQMSYVTEFTNENCYTERSENFTTDVLSRVTINNVAYFRKGIDYGEIAAAQRDDADMLTY